MLQQDVVMLGNYDLQETADQVLNQGHIQECDALNLDRDTYDVSDAGLLIWGDMTGTGQVKSELGIVVKGTIHGQASRVLIIETVGDLVVFGDLSHAQISARTIRVGGEIDTCTLHAREGIECGGDISDSRIVIGEFGPEKREIDQLVEQLEDVVRSKDLRTTQLRLEQKRLFRHFETTRINMDFSLGKIIRKRHNRIDIDLRPFYKLVGDRSEREIDLALRKFYAKGVAGLLTRVNRGFLTHSPNRRRILGGVIKDFYSLFEETRAIDKLKQQILDLNRDIQRQVAILNHRACRICVRGMMYPNLKMKFITPAFTFYEGQTLIPDHNTLFAELAENEMGERIAICTHSDGDEHIVNMAPDQVQDIGIGVFEGQISIGKISSNQAMEALVL